MCASDIHQVCQDTVIRDRVNETPSKMDRSASSNKQGYQKHKSLFSEIANYTLSRGHLSASVSAPTKSDKLSDVSKNHVMTNISALEAKLKGQGQEKRLMTEEQDDFWERYRTFGEF